MNFWTFVDRNSFGCFFIAAVAIAALVEVLVPVFGKVCP